MDRRIKLLRDETSHGLGTQRESCTKKWAISDDFGLRSPAIQTPFQATKSATSIVARAQPKHIFAKQERKFSDDFELRSPVIRKPVSDEKCHLHIVARAQPRKHFCKTRMGIFRRFWVKAPRRSETKFRHNMPSLSRHASYYTRANAGPRTAIPGQPSCLYGETVAKQFSPRETRVQHEKGTRVANEIHSYRSKLCRENPSLGQVHDLYHLQHISYPPGKSIATLDLYL